MAFFRRSFPSANAILLNGPRPVLVDPGFGSDTPSLIAWLHAQATPPERLALIVNTHFDCDHVGANHVLAGHYVLPIAAHHIEATAVNARDPAACRARYLHQPVEPYRIAWALRDGDVIDTGAARWTVLHTPGHTAGHISLHAPDHGLLISGDTVHSDDLGWIDATQPDMLDAAAATLQRLAALPVRCAWSGHGPATQDPGAAISEATRRLQAWRQKPQAHGLAWRETYSRLQPHGQRRAYRAIPRVVPPCQPLVQRLRRPPF